MQLNEKAEVEHWMQEPEHHLRQVLDQTDAVIFWKDLAGRYLFVNHGFCALVGRPLAAILGRRDDDVLAADAAGRFQANDRRVIESRSALAFEEQGEFGGELRTFLVNKFPLLDPAGEPYAVCGIATDITARKRLEEGLHAAAMAVSGAEGETAFAELAGALARILGVDLTFIAIFAPDRSKMRTLAFHLDGQTLPNVDYGLAGTPCEQVVGRSFQYFPACLSAQFPGDAMFRALGVEGYAAFPLADAQGRSLGLIAAVSRRPLSQRDFTESILKIFAARTAAEIARRGAEEALRLSETSYRNIFDASADAIFIHDYDTGAIVDVNPAACRNYGYSREELLALDVSSLSAGVPPYTGVEVAGWIARASGGERVQFEWYRRNKDGSLHWDEVVLHGAEIAGKQRILAFTREITERKAAEAALRASEEQYRAIFNASEDGLVLWNSEMQRVDVNSAYERIYGASREEVLAGLYPPPMPSAYREARQELVRRSLAGETCRAELESVRKDGRRVFVEVRTIPFRHRGEPHVLAIVRDVTERRRADEMRLRLESQLRQAQKMEAIGQLTGGIAHDFNNILTTINGYLALAEERQAELGDARLARYLEQARGGAGRARDLIRQMLTFSRGQKGIPRRIALPALIEELAGFLQPMLPASIEFTVAPCAGPADVLADPVQLEQVLMNLCINARDALGGRGRVQVAVGSFAGHALCASCRSPVAGPLVTLEVADNGPGMAPDVLERIFEPFFSTKEAAKGSGMGLATVHGIVHELGGHVLVDSAPGQGSRFRVLLPALPAEGNAGAGAQPVSVTVSPQPLSGRVLVVDDEQMVVGFLGELFEGRGLQVSVCRDGLAARETFAARPDQFDLVVSDQTMPRMSGLELAREVRRIRPDIPIILLSGFAEGLSEDTLQAAGVNLLVPKPVEPDQLMPRIAELLARCS